MYYNPQYIANLLYMSVFKSKYCVTMDSRVQDAITVKQENNQEIKFTHCNHVLYKFDTAKNIPVYTSKDKTTTNESIDISKSSVTGYSFVSTVSANKEHFTQQKTEGADNARLLQGRIGCPYGQDYKRYLPSNQINNCKPTVDKINTEAAIYGTLVPTLQGKTTQRKPQHSAQVNRVLIPPLTLHKQPTYSISTDFLFVGGLPYLLRVVPAPDGTIYLVDINGTRYSGSI